MNKNNGITAGKIIVWIVIALFLFITIFPFFWVVRTSLTPNKLLFTEATKLFPSQATIKNYARVLGLVSTEESLALGVFRSQTPQGQPDWCGLMAGTVMAIIPAMIIYTIMGKKIVNSIQFNGFR